MPCIITISTFCYALLFSLITRHQYRTEKPRYQLWQRQFPCAFYLFAGYEIFRSKQSKMATKVQESLQNLKEKLPEPLSTLDLTLVKKLFNLLLCCAFGYV